jgi:hypothetical protein
MTTRASSLRAVAPLYKDEGCHSSQIGDHVVAEVKVGIAHHQHLITDTGAGTAVILDGVIDDDRVFNCVPGLESDAGEKKGPKRPHRDDIRHVGPIEHHEQDVERHEVGVVENDVQVLLGAIELKDVAQQSKCLLIGHMQYQHLDELDDVLHNMNALDDCYGDIEADRR